MKKTLYIHGLDGFLSEDKKNILSEYSQIIAPILDFRTNNKTYYDLKQLIIENEIETIIGTSMGGFLGYYLSLHAALPALLFNPALPFRNVEQDVPDQKIKRTSYLRVIIGGKDDIIDPRSNMDWIIKNERGEVDIHWINTLGHRIPINIFEKEVVDFYNICK
ncbi:MAG: hypothetical protein IPL08_14955 [Saprospiraceae bacterium]|nr:hypothetical protein [Saprospiraceae bacterium]